MASMAWLSRSAREPLDISTPDLRPKVLQGPELELLHSSFGPPKLLRDFSNALLFDKTLEDHQPAHGVSAPIFNLDIV
jgi:hypothetical protein